MLPGSQPQPQYPDASAEGDPEDKAYGDVVQGHAKGHTNGHPDGEPNAAHHAAFLVVFLFYTHRSTSLT
jgi:hypothetical protein